MKESLIDALLTRPNTVPRDLQQYVGISYGAKPTIEELSISDIDLDESQRYYNANNVKKYIKTIKGFDWNLFGVPTVVKYPDGTLRCVNGQHRLEILKMLLPSVKTVHAHVIDFSDYTEEMATIKSARLFSNTNGRTISKVKAEDLFWADIVANDPDALHLQDVLMKCHLSCGKVNDVPGLYWINEREGEQGWSKPVKFATFEKCVHMSEDATIYAASLINEAWKHDNTFGDLFFTGLVKLFTTEGYETLMDPSTACGKEFEQWVLGLSNTFALNGKSLRFMRYRENSSDWAIGTALGIFEMFKENSKKCKISAVSLKNAYQSDSVDNS